MLCFTSGDRNASEIVFRNPTPSASKRTTLNELNEEALTVAITCHIARQVASCRIFGRRTAGQLTKSLDAKRSKAILAELVFGYEPANSHWRHELHFLFKTIITSMWVMMPTTDVV